MESLHQRLGPHAMVGEVAKLGAEDTLQYHPCEDKSQNVYTFAILDEDSEAMPKWGTYM